jgi:hypothetical protein
VDSVTKDTYICTKHFVGEKGPTLSHPDPVPALACSEVEKALFAKRSKRKPPKERKTDSTCDRRKKF